VLVVEDNPELRRLLAATLGFDFQVTTAFDGQDGLEKALNSPPDLVLTDLMMPRMDGEGLVRELRSRPELASIPIVILTAKADEAVLVRLLSEGANDHVMKPFSTEELIARISNLVSLKRARDVLQRELVTTRGDVEELARELVRRRHELAIEVRERARAEEAAKVAVGLRDEFLSVASHELRTPLASLVLALRGIDKTSKDTTSDRTAALSARLTRFTDIAVRQGDRLARLVDELLDAARVDAGLLSLRMEELDLRKVVDQVVASAQPELSRARCSVSVEGEPCVPARGDRSKLEQVIVNLLSNAAKFGPGRPIEVSVAKRGSVVAFAVRDHGIGVDPTEHARIFKRFERAVSAHHYGGLGLGLYICNCIVEAHGGSIRVDSRPGDGSLFTVELPSAAPAPAGAAGEAQECL
jgi:signal transduction histidine kinase